MRRDDLRPVRRGHLLIVGLVFSVVAWSQSPPAVTLGEREMIAAIANLRSQVLTATGAGVSSRACGPLVAGAMAEELLVYSTDVPAGATRRLQRLYAASLFHQDTTRLGDVLRLTARHPALARPWSPDTLVRCLAAHGALHDLIREDALATEYPHRILRDTLGLVHELAAYGLRAGQRVADVGAGFGTVAAILAHLDLRVTANEIDAWSLELMHRRQHDRRPGEPGHFDVVRGGKSSTGLAAGSQDVVLVRNALHHFRREQGMLAAIRSALAPGGRVLVVDLFTENPTALEGCEHRTPEAEAHGALSAAGFELLRREEVNGWVVLEWGLPGA